MNNPRLAGRYAKSLIDIANEQNQLDAIYKDIRFLQGVCKGNPDFVAVLRSPIISPDKKAKIIEAITKERVGVVTSAFIRLLITKGREINLPEIITVFIDQFNTIRNIHKVKLTTAVAVGDDVSDAIVARIKATSNISNIELEKVVKEELIGGFVLETGGNLIDASILRDLNDVRKQFLNNDYIHKIR